MSQTATQVPKIIFKCHIIWNDLLHAFEIRYTWSSEKKTKITENEFRYSTEIYGYQCVDYFQVMSVSKGILFHLCINEIEC